MNGLWSGVRIRHVGGIWLDVAFVTLRIGGARFVGYAHHVMCGAAKELNGFR